MNYQVLLYYKYTPIEDPEAEKRRQEELFARFGLTGRVLIAPEGINGTLEGTVENTEHYIAEMVSDKRFADIHWKRSEGNGKAFPKVKIKVRDEIVSLHLGEDDVDPNVTTGKYITADELHELYESGKEFYVVDMRNDYEQKVGHFENAILMPMKNFRELPETLKEIEHLKDKLVVTTCTGGIRCEKASGFLVKHGFTNVYQLYGGMHTYIEKYPNSHFLGKLYVFDGRVVWGINTDDEDHEVISHCDKCGEQSDNYVDCAYLHCKGHRHLILCEKHADEDGNYFCCDDCRQLAYAEQKMFVR
ncbi:MAG: Thiosulfate sulfurtransferase GlpE [candidate division WS6 bacterium OLB20]|uniref:tRNA uridine(34) hydroxylase n=1 Tax=candidate division WS6 bacterium OLB20 TaxID=1617426 RepID=A0A136LWP7_9BACT|nr:MAG: Thiosulfate sulfurtransferase GlpE [candidate division WS6 bacterium OLB20]